MFSKAVVFFFTFCRFTLLYYYLCNITIRFILSEILISLKPGFDFYNINFSTFSLRIADEPEVSAERSIVLGGLSLSSELTCVVYADPPADVVWYRETMRLDPNGKRYMESRGSKHTLIVRKIEKEDFANYSCYATNTLGRAKAFVYLRGVLAVS